MPKTTTPATETRDDPTAGDSWIAERRRGRIERLLDRIPPVYRQPGELHPDVAEWVGMLADGQATNLVLVGGIGVGKTWHAWHAALAALEAGWDGRIDFAAADEFRARIAPTDGGGAFGRQILMADAGLLILDDIGAHRSTDWYLEALWAVVNRRHEQQLPTVVTSNMPDLASEVGARVASRLAADAVVVVLDGPDRRRS